MTFGAAAANPSDPYLFTVTLYLWYNNQVNKKIFGNIFNFLLFGGYGVYCWYYSRTNFDPDEINVFLEILKHLGIFIAARMGAALLHQFGHLFFAAAAGFRVMYFEACFFKFWHDGERVRFGLFFDPRLFFSGTVIIKLKDAFDTAAGFTKNQAKYSKFLLGGFIFNIAAVFIAIVIYVLCLFLPAFPAVFGPLFLVSLSVMLSCWFMIYNAFDDGAGKRGDFISFIKSRDAESLVLTLAAQSIVENIDHAFLFTEAQNVIAFKIRNGLPWLDRHAMNTLAAVAFYACAKRADFNPEIETYLNAEFFAQAVKHDAEQQPADSNAITAERDKKLFLVIKIKNFVAYYALNYGRERALEILETGADAFKKLRLRDNSFYMYFCDVREMLKEKLDADELDTLSYTKFMSTDSYAMGFKNFREINDLAEDNVHQAIYGWQDEQA